MAFKSFPLSEEGRKRIAYAKERKAEAAAISDHQLVELITHTMKNLGHSNYDAGDCVYDGQFRFVQVPELLKRFDRLRAKTIVAMPLAVEFGYRCCEKGMNLQAALAEAAKHKEVTPARTDGLDGIWDITDPRRAFVEGMKWWQWHQYDATAFPSEVDAAETEARKRYG